jgi:hypothetical protein
MPRRPQSAGAAPQAAFDCFAQQRTLEELALELGKNVHVLRKDLQSKLPSPAANQ